jgi:hypothetical protein
MDRLKERREGFQQGSDRLILISTDAGPHGDVRIEPTNSIGILARKLLEHAAIDHEILQERLAIAGDTVHEELDTIRLRLIRSADTVCLALLLIEMSIRGNLNRACLTLCALDCGLSIDSDLGQLGCAAVMSWDELFS